MHLYLVYLTLDIIFSVVATWKSSTFLSCYDTKDKLWEILAKCHIPIGINSQVVDETELYGRHL